jgi:hypothetical protein
MQCANIIYHLAAQVLYLLISVYAKNLTFKVEHYLQRSNARSSSTSLHLHCIPMLMRLYTTATCIYACTHTHCTLQVSQGGNIVNYAISEHVENAGVHSGDATLLLPAQKLWVETIRRVKRVASAICKALNISGPFNIQLMARENEIKVCSSSC